MKNKIKVILSLGSNMGDKKKHLNLAISSIKEFSEVKQISSFYETPSWGFKADDFLNICMVIFTSLSPKELLISLLEVEKNLGRVRKNETKNYQSREIDIDIIAYGQQIINEEDLIIPHPLMQDRLFVLEPLKEVDPSWRHPISLDSVDVMINTIKNVHSN